MNWNDLQYFIALVENRTLSATANKLNVQHTTVARRIEALEADLNIKLFEHIGKRYTITQDGAFLYEQAKHIREQVMVFERRAFEHNKLQGEVVISTPNVLANQLILPKLPIFHQRYPSIKIRLIGETQISNLHQKQADIALRLIEPIENDLVRRHVTDFYYGFFVSQNYLKVLKQTTCAHWQFIEFSANSRLFNWTQQVVEVTNADIIMNLNDLYMVKSAIEHGLGIGILPNFLIKEADNLVQIHPVTGEVLLTFTTHLVIHEGIKAFDVIPLYLVMHEDVRRSSRVRVVADWLVEIFDAK